MVGKNFEIGDLVWAKMKGYPSWPGKISSPPIESSAKKAQHYVYFFGSENFAWIPDENIELHSQKMVEKYTRNQKRPAIYLNAVDEIVFAGGNILKYMEDSDSSLDEFASQGNEDNPDDYKNIIAGKKGGSTERTYGEKIKFSAEKGKLQREKKKVSGEKSSVKKDLKRISSFDDEKSFESPSKSQRSDEDYSELSRNLPPNYSYSSESVSSYDNDIEMISRNEYEDPENLSSNAGNEFSKSDKMDPTPKKIGFLGLGVMGQYIVKNLIESGHSVTVWNRTRSKYDKFDQIEHADTAENVIKTCDIIFSCMSSPEVSKEVVFEPFGVKDGFDAATGEKKGFVELTSIDHQTSEAIDQAITLKGGRYLEAQLTGSRDQANAGTLFILASGDKSLFNDCESCFNAIGKSSLYLGADAGVACKFNIVLNMLLGTSYAAIAESLALIEPIGLGPSDFLDILKNGPLNSHDIIDKGYCMLNKNAVNNTPLQHMHKNFSFALALGSSVEQPMPLAAATNEVYKHCKLLGYANDDISAVFRGTKQ